MKIPPQFVCVATLPRDLLSRHTVVWLGYLVYCMFVCTVTDFLAAER